MKTTLPVNQVPTLLKLELSGQGVAWVVVLDPTQPNTHYFRRSVTLRGGKRTLIVPLPVTPRLLELEVFQDPSHPAARVQARLTEVKPMPPQTVWADPVQHRFMEFAIDFARKAGYVPAGFYPSPTGEFLIQYLPTIRDQAGEELVTPARIHQLMPRVQLSRKQFRGMSIPRRVKILSHEYCHFLHNTRSETEADKCGIDYYVQYGFPRVEGVYSLTKVFRQNPDSLGPLHTQRVAEVMRTLDQYPNRFQNAFRHA